MGRSPFHSASAAGFTEGGTVWPADSQVCRLIHSHLNAFTTSTVVNLCSVYYKFLSFSPLILSFCSKNENNSQSETVPYRLDVVVRADVILQGWVQEECVTGSLRLELSLFFQFTCSLSLSLPHKVCPDQIRYSSHLQIGRWPRMLQWSKKLGLLWSTSTR